MTTGSRPAPAAVPVPALVLAVAVAALYLPGLGRGFVSEDFLILRRLHEGGAALVGSHFAGPWLGISLVAFYRPVSTLVLWLEQLAFGVHPLPSLLVHLGVHGANTALVFAIARRLVPTGRVVPWGVAALFALYPLHPNTVLFVASFATLFGAAFFLAAVRLHLAARPRTGAVVVCQVLALGCYEQAAVLPALLLVLDLVAPDGLAPGRRPAWGWRGLARRHAVYWLVLAAYLLVRRLALGGGLGGYPTFHDRLDPSRWPALAAESLRNLARLLDPDYAAPVASWTVPVLGAGLVVALAWACRHLVRRRSAPSPTARLGLLAVAWVGLVQAPFLFNSVVPGNGRYAYLASVGLALGLATVARALADAAARWTSARTATVLAAVLLGLVTVRYGALLASHVGLYAEAGRAAEVVRARAIAAADDGGPVFVAGTPDFLRLGGVPAAQVFHWGLADAVRPPFTDRALDVYDLPPLDDASLGHLAAHRRVLRWDGHDLSPVAAETASPTSVEVLAAPPRLRWRPEPAARHRLVVVAPGGHHVAEVEPGLDEAGPPAAFVQSMTVLYPATPILAWIEIRSADGALEAASPVVELVLP